MDRHEAGSDEFIRRQAAARNQESAAVAGVGTPGYAPPSSFSFDEPTGRGTAARIAVVLAAPLAAFLGLAMMGGEKGAGLVLLVWVACGVAFYVLPMVEAHLRKQPNFVSIALVNVFLGWTVVGWVVAMAWGCAAGTESSSATPASKEPLRTTRSQQEIKKPVSVADELRKLADLKAQGILSDEEFAEQKAKVLAG